MIGTRDWLQDGYVDVVELDGASLYVGCRDCTDASPDVLWLHSVSATGFRGAWVNPQSGIVRATRKDGSLAPNPGGHFCAVRVKETDR